MARASKPSSKTSKPKASKATKAKPKAAKLAPKKVKASAKAGAAKKTAAPKKAAVAKPAKKAAPKPDPKPSPPVKKKKAKPEVTARDIRKIKDKLLEQRAEYQKEYADLEEGSRTSQSEASGEASFDEEYADAGSYTFEREKELSIGNNIRDLLSKVDHALIKIEKGTYGICDNCGNPIAKARVLALPHSSLCLSCKQIEERTR